MQTKLIDETKAKPFLKWAGGKKQVVNFIENNLPQKIKEKGVIDKYFEPFVGGGAVFFHLINNYKIKCAYLGDINKELMLTYNVVKKDPESLISLLKSFSDDFLPLDLDGRKEYYYNIRNEYNQDIGDFDYKSISDEHILRASQMIFLNKTCFNGLYRVNKNGKFNVPIGRYKKPLICDENNIMNVSNALKGVKLRCYDYHFSEKYIDDKSFVYLDPPYLPVKKDSFTSYDSTGFGVTEQIELSEYCKKIDSKNAKFILSNSHSEDNIEFFNEHYGLELDPPLFNYSTVDVKRFINSDSSNRSAVKELLIYNY